MTPILVALSLPFVGALSVFALRRWSPRLRGLYATGLAFVSFLLILVGATPVFRGETVTFGWEWFPQLGVQVLFYVDGLSVMFSLLISGIGTLICLYAAGYLHEERINLLFWFSLLFFMGSMLGVVISGDFIVLLIFWELTSISSFLLIGIHYWDAESRRSALNALFVTAAGGLALLAGLLMVAAQTGSFSLPHLLHHGLTVSPWTSAAMGLILLGAFSKSAHFPFHFWLPQAMAAPTPVSAYLHSATMVKAGIYLIIRLYPVFAVHPFWSPTLLVMGLVTFLVGGTLAVSREDAKALLAYSTVSQLGMITFMLGISVEAGLLGAIFHILAHATFKGALFMGAGAIEHTLGTRRLDELGPLVHSMPWLAGVMMVCGLSMAGVIPLSGFVSKESMFAGLLASGQPGATTMLVGAIGASILTFLYSMRLVLELPFGPARAPAEHTVHHPPDDFDHFCLVAPPSVLAVGTALLGVGVATWFGPMQALINRMITGVGGAFHPYAHPHAHFKLWHGFGLPLLFTGLVIGVGLLLYALLSVSRGFWDRLARLPGPEDGNRVFQDHLVGVCYEMMAPFIQGPTSKYLRVILVFTLLLAGVSWMVSPATIGARHLPWLPSVPVSSLWIPFLVVFLGGLGVLRFNHPVPAVIAVGALGFLVSTIFLVYAAPDLIMTQMAVETVSIVIFLWVLKDIDFSDAPDRAPRVGDLVLSGVIAVGLGYVLMRALTLHPGSTAPAKFYKSFSVPEAWGHNMVNVILVDFRALDTMGEISVLGIATVGILALLGVTFRRSAFPAEESD